MPRRTKDDAEKTRNAILDAAEDLFYAYGVTRTSLEQIAEAAGVTRGAVYWHFNFFPDLFEAMAHRAFLPHEDFLASLAAQPSETPLEDLQKACLHALLQIGKDSQRLKVFTILSLRCEYVQEMKKIINRRNVTKKRVLILAEKLFSRAKELKRLAPQWTPRQAAVAMQALVMGLILQGLEDKKNYNLSTVGVSCIEAFFKSLQAN